MAPTSPKSPASSAPRWCGWAWPVTAGRWSLDLDRLFDALTPDTRALYLGSPNNPTGWTIEAEALAAIFERCRRYGIWLVTDDVYERLCFRPGQPVAPSLLGQADPDDRLISVNSFSKTWCMTGWRIGWLVAPPAIVAELAKVIEYNSSCVPDFVQAGAMAALDGDAGETFITPACGRNSARRGQQLVTGLKRHQAIEVPEADGAMYAFFRIDGEADSMRLAEQLLGKRRAGAGARPGLRDRRRGLAALVFCRTARKARRRTRPAGALSRLAPGRLTRPGGGPDHSVNVV